MLFRSVLTGRTADYFNTKGREVDFYDLKGVAEYLAARLRLGFSYLATKRPKMHPGQTADIFLGGKLIGYLGQVDPSLVIQPVYYLEIELEPLAVGLSHIPSYKALTRFPAVLRDLALVGPKTVPAENLIKAIYEAGGTYLRSVELFDMYTSAQIGVENRSLAYSLIFQSEERTLTDAEIDSLLQNITAKMATLGFSIRS